MALSLQRSLPDNLRRLQVEIEGHALSYGLDFFDVIFELVDYEELSAIAAQGGFPSRYPHWRFGMEYEQLSKSYRYGLSKIYELVINNDPCYAYLLDSNAFVDQKLVMAHVYGHCLAPETPVVTPRGILPIREVRVGDWVRSHTGAWRPVRVHATRPYQGDIVRLRLEGSDQEVLITPEHPVLVQAQPAWRGAEPVADHDRLAWLPAGELRVGDLLACPHASQPASATRATLALVGVTGAAHDSREALAEDYDFCAVSALVCEPYRGMVHNFSVARDESYTLGAGLVVHNCDFFKNNIWFAHTNRKMMDETANHGNRIRDIMEKHGESEVEDFIDVCLSLEDLIDIHAPHIKRPDYAPPDEDHKPDPPTRFESKEYMDSFMNPKQALKAEAERIAELDKAKYAKFPREPQKDVLLFLIEHGNLKPWQRDVLSIIREEAYYFAPQGQTKIMNEGWASYWHSTIMCQKGMDDTEVIDFADHHSGTMAMSPGSFNPYKIGIELFRDIEDRWNRGRFGKEYEECDDPILKQKWDKNLGLGRKRIFEVRQTHNDITFIDTFLTEDFCRRHKLFSFAFNKNEKRYQIESREFAMVKERLLFQLTNHGRPFIYVEDSNFRNRKELFLRHKHLGVDLRLDYARDVSVNVWKIWSRPVHVATIVDGQPVLLTYDGHEHTTKPQEKE